MRPCHQAACRLFQCADPLWCEQYQKQCQHEDCINISRCETPYLCQDYEPISATQLPAEQVIVHRHSDMSKQNYDLLQQTARRVEYLEKKLAERTKVNQGEY